VTKDDQESTRGSRADNPELGSAPDGRGYELYSWQVFDQWLYVLVPAQGTHSWAELAAAKPFHEREELKQGLAKLHKGAQVTWRNHCEGAPPGRLNRPLGVFQQELVDFCREHKITLTTEG
jgi:hypothetical protein